MPFGGDRPRPSLARAFAVLLGLGALVPIGGATCSSEAQPGSQPAATGPGHDEREHARDPGSNQPRVGNPSNTGMETVPDWDALAADLRERVGPRMPDPLPTDVPSTREAACARMLEEALAFYVETEINPEYQRQRRADMAATRDADLRACVEETSVAAATCVTILLGDRNAEFPWLLDQCSRAYPRAQAGSG